MKWRIVVIVVALAIGNHSANADGFFLSADGVFDRLVRVDFDGTITEIGEEGAFGFPNVTRLAWDPESQTLYGYEDTFDFLLRIDIETSEAEVIGPTMLEVAHWTFNTTDGFIYGLQGCGGVPEGYRIDPQAGDQEIVEGSCQSPSDLAVAFVPDAFPSTNIDAIYSPIGSGNGLVVRVGPTLDRILLWGDLPDATTSLTFDSVARILYAAVPNAEGTGVYEVNRTTGNATLLFEIEANLPNLVFVDPDPSTLGECERFDSDGDNDVDLVDFQEFQLCFTGG